MRRTHLLYLFFSLVMIRNVPAQNHGPAGRPNIVLILADDLGYGDLSVYGGDVPVPSIQRLAEEGLRFTDFHSNGAVCSPTRAALLTGRYQQRMGIEKALSPADAGLGDAKAKGEVTIAGYLKDAGYHTGVFGKWHLGSSPGQSPLNYGFHEFVGMLHGSGDYHSKVTTSGEYDWWHNDKIVDEKTYNTDLITHYSLQFIEKHKDQPFFLYVAQNAIHFPWQTPADPAHRKTGLTYSEVSGPLNKLGQHPPGEVREVVRTMITEMDKSIGLIMAKLRELNLDKNTIVLFLSDNGGIVQYLGGYTNISSNKPLRGEKGKVYEGGHRVPAIAWWPGHIASGSVTDQTVMTMDIMPTLLSLVKENSGPVLKNKTDGISIQSLLFHGKPLPERTLFWKHRDAYAVRSGAWKLVLNEGNVQPELYRLSDDLSETNDLSGRFPDIVRKLSVELERWKKDVYSKN